MTTEEQARLLAAWLDDPRNAGSEPPAGVDPDVIEAIHALRPDLAPPPRIDLDDLLGSLTEGPLASTTATAPPAAPAPPAEVVSLDARRRRWLLPTAATGTLLAMAAAALLVVLLDQQQAPMSRTAAYEQEAPRAEATAPSEPPAGIVGARAASDEEDAFRDLDGDRRGDVASADPDVAKAIRPRQVTDTLLREEVITTTGEASGASGAGGLLAGADGALAKEKQGESAPPPPSRPPDVGAAPLVATRPASPSPAPGPRPEPAPRAAAESPAAGSARGVGATGAPADEDVAVADLEGAEDRDDAVAFGTSVAETTVGGEEAGAVSAPLADPTPVELTSKRSQTDREVALEASQAERRSPRLGPARTTKDQAPEATTASTGAPDLARLRKAALPPELPATWPAPPVRSDVTLDANADDARTEAQRDDGGILHAATITRSWLDARAFPQAVDAAETGLALPVGNTPERSMLLVLYGDALAGTGDAWAAAAAYESARVANDARRAPNVAPADRPSTTSE